MICYRAGDETRKLELRDRNKNEDHLCSSQDDVVQCISVEILSQMLAPEIKGWSE